MNELPPSVRLTGIGFYIGITIAIGVIGGRELDKLFDTGKVLTLVGLGLGLFFALWGGMRQLLQVLDAINQRRRRDKQP